MQRNTNKTTEIQNSNIEAKVCSKCKQELSIDMFYKHTRDGYQCWCKTCKSKYYQANKHYDLYVVYDEFGTVQYIGSTTEGINVRMSKHKYANSYAGRVASGDILGKILFIRLDEYNLVEYELRYIEQLFIDNCDPLQNKYNACINLDYIEADRFAYIHDLYNDLLDNFNDIAITYVDRTLEGLDNWLEGNFTIDA